MFHIITRFLGGMVIVAIGVVFVIKSEWFLQNFGAIGWAEQHLGLDGGSRLFYKLFGVMLAIVGISLATGLLGNIIVGTLGGMFGGARAPQQ
jgi:hypothetical protein